MEFSKAKRNLIFVHECEARMGLGVDDELFEYVAAEQPSGDTIEGAH
jgi:hypothetical protein